MILGLAFALLYVSVDKVEIQYVYFFYTLTGFGLVYLINYALRFNFLNTRLKHIKSNEFDDGIILEEMNWIPLRISEVERYRKNLQIIMALGLIMLLVGFAGFYKQLIGSSGLGVLFGSSIWFCFELFSELHLKEYQNYLENRR